jgi:DNA-binding HxlR family transcriptional regulator
MTMIQRKFYLPEDMYKQLQLLAKTSKQTITDTLRSLVAEGLAQRKQYQKGSASALVELAHMAEQEGWRSDVHDLSMNHDKYAAEAAEADVNRIHDYYG